MSKTKNNVLFMLYTIILGLIVGLIIWGFLRIMNYGVEFLWGYLPSLISFPLYTVCVCTAGGLIIGIWKRKFGDYPEELTGVIAKIKKTGRYSYNNVFSTIVSALIPLLIGASVGPEAGLTGVIAGLCTWVGDKLKGFRKEVQELTSIGMSATLGTIFRSPMFGFMEPLESDDETTLPKTSKIVLYFAATLSSFGIFILMNKLFGIKMGMEGIEGSKIPSENYLYAVPLVLVGIAAGYLFFAFKKLTGTLEHHLKKYVVLRAVCCGLILCISGTFLPLTMFSGEHQITEVMADMEKIGAVMLLIIAAAKLLLTNICIDTGLKGGLFFPVIFCGISIGCAMSLLLGINVLFSTAIVTTALVGHTLKKPMATVPLLMILFPPRLIPIMLFASAAAKFIPTPAILLPNETNMTDGETEESKQQKKSNKKSQKRKNQ